MYVLGNLCWVIRPYRENQISLFDLNFTTPVSPSYEERARYISNLSRNCEKAVSLEEFFVEVVQPGQPDAYTPAHCDVPAAWKAEKSSNQHGSVLMVPVQVIQPASRMVPKSPSEATYDVGSVAPMTEMGEDVFT